MPEHDFEKRIIYWHVVRLIGWDRDAADRLHWIAINSFGSQWGDNGERRARRAADRDVEPIALGLFKIDTSLLERFGLEYETALG